MERAPIDKNVASAKSGGTFFFYDVQQLHKQLHKQHEVQSSRVEGTRQVHFSSSVITSIRILDPASSLMNTAAVCF